MKTRSGFVSNSSSSSFCIFGIETVYKQVLEILQLGPQKIAGCKHEFNREEANFCPECGKKAWIIEQPGWDDIQKACEPWEFWQLPETDWCYVGTHIDDSTIEGLVALQETTKGLETKFKQIPKVHSGEYYS